jgi:hypothetical protein
VDDLEVDGELLAVVVEDEDADAATAGLESGGEAAPEVGLVDDGQVLLDVTGLGHGDNVAVLEVKDTVLLEDRAEHGLNDNAGGRVGDEGGLLVQLLGEEVDTEVTVLTGGSRRGDADDLAGTTLKHQEVTEADVGARDGDGVGEVRLARVTGARPGSRGRGSSIVVNIDVDVGVVLVGVDDAVRELVDATAEGVVVAVLVVVTHLGLLVGARVAGRLNGLLRDLHVLVVARTRGSSVNSEVAGDVDVLGLELSSRRRVDSAGVVGTVTLAVFTLSDVDGAAEGLMTVVNFDVSLGVVGARSLRSSGLVDVGLVLMLLDTGTAVTFFFTCYADLFFDAVFAATRKFSGSRERRVLTLPSGFRFLGNADVNLLGCLGLSLGFTVPIGRGEDAEGDRDAGFKVQVGDFC